MNILQSKLAMLALAICSIAFASALAQGQASALSGSDFNAANIVDNNVFFNKDGMSVSDIQAFLNAKVPVCDTNGTQPSGRSGYATRADWGRANGNPPPYTCLKDYPQSVPGTTADSYCSGGISAGTKNAAQIIYDVSQACGVNPKAIIVLLQKEQGLVTDEWPWPGQYRGATGYGCPDTSACDSTYYGFFNQVYNAARQFQRYVKQPSNFNYAVNRTSFIAYQANRPDCGGTNVNIQNGATAALYNYTPYQPNAAALANLSGTGDACSAYGNRNFWKYFNDWFGSTRTMVASAPFALSASSGRTNVFTRANDGRLLQKWFDGSSWLTTWDNLAGTTINSTPAGVSWGNGHMDLFEVTADGNLRHRYYLPDATGWRGWENLGHPGNSTLIYSPAVISSGPGKINVFVKGADGRLWEKWFDGHGWVNTWNNLGGDMVNSSMSAISWGNGHVDLFQTASDGTIWHRYYLPDAIGWRGWEGLGRPNGPYIASPPAAVTSAYGRINIFAKGSDGRLWEKWFDGTNWNNPWNNVTGSSVNSTPAAISWGNGHIDLFETTGDGTVRHMYYLPDATGWRGWEYL